MNVSQKRSYPVKWGIDNIRDADGKPIQMTPEQAQKYGDRHMDQGLKRVGFSASVYVTTLDLHGGEWIRITVSKSIPSHRTTASTKPAALCSIPT